MKFNSMMSVQVEIRGHESGTENERLEVITDMSISDILFRTDLTNEAAATALLLFWNPFSTALPPVMF